MIKKKNLKILLVLAIPLIILLIYNGKSELATGVVYYTGLSDDWHVSYEYDHKRYEMNYTNYITMTYTGDDSDFELNNLLYEVICRDSRINGSIGGSSYEEKLNEKGQREFTFLIGTVNRETYIGDEYIFNIIYSTTNGAIIDTVILKHAK